VINEAMGAVGEIPGKLESDVLEGPAAAAILREAEIHQNDLIVMGSRSLGPLSGILLGSQSLKVLHYAQCPVLIVP
jgi:nucleotide-binding universal stress UspA family protein